MPALKYDWDQQKVYIKESLKILFQKQSPPHELVRQIHLLIVEAASDTADGDFEQKNIVLIVKDELTLLLKNKSILTELVFKEMWWHKNNLMRSLSTYLLPLFLSNFKELLPYLRKLDSHKLTELVAVNLLPLTQKNPTNSIIFMDTLSCQGNKYQRKLVILMIQYTLQEGYALPPALLSLLKKLSTDSEMEVRSLAREVHQKYFSGNG